MTMKEQFNNLKKTLILAIVISVFSCSNNDEPVLSDTLSTSYLKSVLKLKDEKALVFKGPEVQYGEGKARSWFRRGDQCWNICCARGQCVP